MHAVGYHPFGDRQYLGGQHNRDKDKKAHQKDGPDFMKDVFVNGYSHGEQIPKLITLKGFEKIQAKS